MGAASKTALISAGFLGALLFGIWWANDESPRGAQQGGTASTGDDELNSVQDETRTVERRDGGRQSLAMEEQDPSKNSAPATGFLLHGRTVDLSARPLGGITLRWNPRRSEAEPVEAITDAAGSFSMRLPHEDLNFVVAEEHFVAVATGWIGAELLVVVAPAVPMRGVVVDEQQQPIADASVRVILNVMSLRDFDRTPDWHQSHVWLTTKSDAAGRFELPRVPVVTDSREADSFVAKRGFQTAHPALPRTGDEDLVVVLHPSEEESPRLVTGIVRAPWGAPVAGAEVTYARQRTLSKEDGSFDLPVDQIYEDMALRATHRDHQPGAWEDLWQELLDSQADVEGVVLVLGPAPLSIQGQVLDEKGRPARGFQVSLEDGTPLGALGEWAELRPHLADAPGVSTDDAGRFHLPGLFDRDYRVRAWQADTGLVLVSAAVPAGTTDLVLRAGSDATEHLTGRAVDRHGRPLPGLEVGIVYQHAPGVHSHWRSAPMKASTDEEGKFDLGSIPRQGVRIVFSGAGVFSDYLEIPTHLDGEPVTIELARVARFRVESAQADAIDSFEVLDAKGEIVRISEFHSWGSVARRRVETTEEGFPVCVCSDAVSTIVFYRGDVEVGRQALFLSAERVNVIEP